MAGGRVLVVSGPKKRVDGYTLACEVRSMGKVKLMLV